MSEQNPTELPDILTLLREEISKRLITAPDVILLDERFNADEAKTTFQRLDGCFANECGTPL